MLKKIDLSDSEFFSLSDFIDENINIYVMTGARGCGKTYSTAVFIEQLFQKGAVGLYVRNGKNELSTARQYFSFLIKNHNIQRINLGSMGAGSVVLEEQNDVGKWEHQTLIAYTLWLSDYELLKSSKRKIDYIIYEEYSSLTTRGINRMFSLTEIIESVRQQNSNYYLFAISNNLYKDDLFNHLLNEDEFIHFEITKVTPNLKVKNKIVKSYLNGDYLIPDININLNGYDCLGYIESGGIKVYIFKNKFKFPQVVLSSKGTGKCIKLTAEIIQLLQNGYYKNLNERNEIEFIIGLLTFAKNKLYV